MKIVIDQEIKHLFPQIKLGYILAQVDVKPSDSTIQKKMNQLFVEKKEQLTPELIRQHPMVKNFKDAYRKLGKDPNRYRPSAESLMRRMASGKELYHVNNVVDILNIISIETGFSIGGYDFDLIQGEITFGKGVANEPYEGIGRGKLNIENLPTFRDDLGAFGTPTSDSTRTMVTVSTKQFLMVFPAFNGEEERLKNTLALAEILLKELASAKIIRSEYR